MNQSKKVLIMGRQHGVTPEQSSREVICVTSDPDTLKRATEQSIVLWVDSATQIAPPRTGVKSFDAIAADDYIGTGNVISNVQYSSCLRSRNTTHCNGFEGPRGRLQDFDLKGLLDYDLENVVRRIKSAAIFEETNGYWYIFRRSIGVERMIYGVLVTDEAHNLVFRFDREDLGRGRTSAGHKILDAMELHVTSKAWQDRQRIYQREAA